MSNVWAASEARAHFGEVVDAAAEGRSQFIRRRDGREVVVVSKEYFEKTKPSLKEFLLSGGFVDDGDDTLDRAYAEARQLLGATLPPPYLQDDFQDENSRHQRDQRVPEKDG